jgi:hypothetical protein
LLAGYLTAAASGGLFAASRSSVDEAATPALDQRACSMNKKKRD